MARLTEKEAAEAQMRRRAYEANMAVEGIVLTEEERAWIDQLDTERMGYEEGLAFLKARLAEKYGHELTRLAQGQARPIG